MRILKVGLYEFVDIEIIIYFFVFVEVKQSELNTIITLSRLRLPSNCSYGPLNVCYILNLR